MLKPSGKFRAYAGFAAYLAVIMAVAIVALVVLSASFKAMQKPIPPVHYDPVWIWNHKNVG